MGYVAYGYGISEQNLGSVNTYGLGLNPIGVKTGSVILGINVDFQSLAERDANAELIFATDLDINIAKQLAANPDAVFVTDLSLEQLNQMAGVADILFDTDLNIEFIKGVDYDDSIDFGIDLDITTAGFLVDFVLNRLHVYVISEEQRILPIYREVRSMLVSDTIRTCSVEFEDRTVIVPIKEEE